MLAFLLATIVQPLQGIVAGYDTLGKSWRGVVNVVYVDSNDPLAQQVRMTNPAAFLHLFQTDFTFSTLFGRTTWCTGTLVHPNAVLTSAQCVGCAGLYRTSSVSQAGKYSNCVPDTLSKQYFVFQSSVNPGLASRNYTALTFLSAVTDVVGIYDWDVRTETGVDLALLKLADPVPSTTPFYRLSTLLSSASLGSKGVIVGVGPTMPLQIWTANSNTLRWGPVMINRVRGSAYNTSLDAACTLTGTSPCLSDVGGPLFVMEKGVWVLAGVYHGPDLLAPCTPYGSYYSSVAANVVWVTQTLNMWGPSWGTNTFLGVGTDPGSLSLPDNTWQCGLIGDVDWLSWYQAQYCVFGAQTSIDNTNTAITSLNGESSAPYQLLEDALNTEFTSPTSTPTLSPTSSSCFIGALNYSLPQGLALSAGLISSNSNNNNNKITPIKKIHSTAFQSLERGFCEGTKSCMVAVAQLRQFFFIHPEFGGCRVDPIANSMLQQIIQDQFDFSGDVCPLAPVYNCLTNEQWTVAKKNWCCTTSPLHVQCNATLNTDSIAPYWFSCFASSNVLSSAGEAKAPTGISASALAQWRAEWCCEEQGFGCDTAFDCTTHLTGSWSDFKTNWCCTNKQLSCPPDDCTSNEVWSPNKIAWCCLNQDLGCENYYQCTNISMMWSTAQTSWCCQHASSAYSLTGITSSSLWTVTMIQELQRRCSVVLTTLTRSLSLTTSPTRKSPLPTQLTAKPKLTASTTKPPTKRTGTIRPPTKAPTPTKPPTKPSTKSPTKPTKPPTKATTQVPTKVPTKLPTKTPTKPAIATISKLQTALRAQTTAKPKAQTPVKPKPQTTVGQTVKNQQN